MKQVHGEGLLPEAADVLAVDQCPTRVRIGRATALELERLFDELARVVELESTRDPVVVGVRRIGECDQRGVLYRIEETEAGDGRWVERRYAHGLHGHDLRRIARDRAMLELRTAELDHRIEARRAGTPETDEVEDRVALPVTGVAPLARRRDEDRAQAVLFGEDTTELFVACQVLPDLRSGHPCDGPVQYLFLGRAAGREGITPGHRQASKQHEGDPQFTHVIPP